MGLLRNLERRVLAEDAARRINAPPPPQLPVPEEPKPDTTVTDRLADVYAQTFGRAASEGSGQIAVVPVGPTQGGGGGGVSLGAVAILAALGLGGYFLYKKVAA